MKEKKLASQTTCYFIRMYFHSSPKANNHACTKAYNAKRN